MTTVVCWYLSGAWCNVVVDDAGLRPSERFEEEHEPRDPKRPGRVTGDPHGARINK